MKNLLCCGVLQAEGGAYQKFPKTTQLVTPGTKHKRVHVPTPRKNERNKIFSRVVMLLLLVVSIVKLVGSTLDIRRQY